MNNSRMFAIYLRDHHAASTGGIDLIERIARDNADTEFAPLLQNVAREIKEDKDALESVMEAVDVKPSIFKQSVMWLGEKLSRLKLNGHLTRYSPLSRVLELEAMTSAVRAKKRLWNALGLIRPYDTRLAHYDFDHLAERALRQYHSLKELHERAVQIAFVGEESEAAQPDLHPVGERA